MNQIQQSNITVANFIIGELAKDKPFTLVLVRDKPVAYMVQNKFWKGEFEVKLLNEMPEPEFEGDSYDVEIPLYMIEAAQEQDQ